jgi:hypothetical protein
MRLALAAALALPVTAGGVASTARPASLLVFPFISVDTGVDTLVRLTHLGDDAQTVRCVYLDGSLTPGTATGFLVTLTPGQPIAWRAGAGLAELPVDGVTTTGVGGTSNSGSIPIAPAMPFSGTLRCLAADTDGTPAPGDTLVGTATIERGDPHPDSVTYAAIGFAATGSNADAPDVLVLGGEMAEYDACPAAVSMQPFLDGAMVELGAGAALQRRTATTVVFTTCSSAPASGGETATIDLELTTELGTRFTARRPVREHLVSDLSRLDSNLPSMSIFDSAIAGSPTGNLRVVPDTAGSGVLALLLTAYVDPADEETAHRAAVPVQMSGQRTLPDLVELELPAPPTPTPTEPPTACTGDCSGDGAVAINELIVGVNIALGNAAVSTCAAFDADAGGDVTINELIGAVNNALNGCE